MRDVVVVCGCLLVVGVLLVPRQARAYRPFDGTDADTAELGEFELELAPVQPLRAGDKTYLSSPIVFNFGILSGVEFVIDMVGVKPLAPERGESSYQAVDTDLVMKFLLLHGSLQEQGSGPSMALEAGVLTPGVNDEDDEHGFGSTANLIVSQAWDGFILHLNNEGELSRKSLEFSWANMLIAELKVSEVAWPVLEFTWEHEMVDSGATAYSGLLGVIWTVTDGLDIDAAAVVGDDDGERFYEGRLGLTWAFPMWGSEDETEHEEEEEERATRSTALRQLQREFAHGHGTRSGV